MRLTNREKIMLIVFIVVVTLSGSIYYLYLPVYDNLQSEKIALESNVATLENIERNIMPIEQQRQLIESFKLKVDIMQRTLPPVIYQEEILREMTGIMNQNSVDVKAYDFGIKTDSVSLDKDQEAIDKILSGYEDTVLDNISKGMVETGFKNTKEIEEAEPAGWEDVVNTIDVSISLEGEYENIKNAIREFEDLESLVLVTNLSVAKDSNFENQVIGTLDLRFPYYYDNETLEKLEWVYESEFEKHKPFDYIIKGSKADPDRPIRTTTVGNINIPGLSDITDTTITDGLYDREAEQSKLLDADFEIMLSAPTSINMDYIIAKGDARDLSLVSQRESETLSLTITESNGGYAFNYSNTFQVFPGENEYHTFTPNYQDSIYVTVVSTPRVDNKDVGMGRLNVYNKTSKPLKIFVKTDDEKLPRLVMGTQEGDISVIHE